MESNRRYFLATALVGILSLALPVTGFCADEDTPRPGQLKGVLSALKEDGDAWVHQGADWLMKREYVDHLLFLVTDPRGGTGGGGWYRPSQGRYSWEWLRQRCDQKGDGAISLDEFGGQREWFEALDKDRDGQLTKEDFDWSSGSPLTSATAKAKSLFDGIDRDGNGRASPEEWRFWFDELSRGKGYLSQDDLMPLFLEKRRGMGPAPAPKTPRSNARLAIVCSYISGDVGSLSEGPMVGEKAPSFSLLPVDGKKRVSIASRKDVDQKPLVLIFGSFT